MAGFAGIDSSGYPGDQVMQWLKANTNLSWCGFYLGPAPSHTSPSWMGKRTVLVSQGWGIAPLYVGQQTIGPGSHINTAQQGYHDGQDAGSLMAKAGFSPGSCVYLDLENGLPFPPEQKAYVGAWADQIAHQGYTPGVYCSHILAADLHQIVPAAMIWAFKVSTTAPHPVPGHNFPDSHPAGSGYAGAFIWQLGQNCLISVPGAPNGRIMVDLDSAVVADPGAPPAAIAPMVAAAPAAIAVGPRGKRRGTG